MDSLCYRLFQDWPELVLELAGLEEGRQEGWREERLRIARSLLDVIADDRLLAEKIGLSVAEVRQFREAAGD